MKESVCYLLMPLRTASARPFCSLSHLDAAGLSGVLLRDWGRRRADLPQAVEEIVFGCTLSGGTGQNFIRAALFESGWPEHLPAYLIDNVCGAGLWALETAQRTLISGRKKTVLVGAVESLSHAPDLLPRPEWGAEGPYDRRSSVLYDALRCSVTGEVMGVLCEMAAKAHGIDRHTQERFARDSHAKARKAQHKGCFAKEIVSVKRRQDGVFDHDEVVRRRWDENRVLDLKPQYLSNGTITAATTAVLVDAAAGVLVTADPRLPTVWQTPAWRLMSLAHHMTHPRKTFEAGGEALQRALVQADLTKDDIDLFEIGEAFAAAALVTMRQMDLPEEKVNVHGGDLALGHPLGAAGMRMLVTLCHALEEHQKRFGALVLGYGGGGASALVLERMS